MTGQENHQVTRNKPGPFRIRRLRHTLSASCLVLLAACAPVGPEFVKPEVALPAEWSAEAENGLEVLEPYCEQGSNSYESGVECGRRLLNKKQRPTAIFCANDEMAIGVKKVAHEMGISIPGSLSIVGFDDTPVASQLYPTLTTIRQPTREMAKLATELLIKRLRGESPEGMKEMLKSELIIRNSAGPAPMLEYSLTTKS